MDEKRSDERQFWQSLGIDEEEIMTHIPEADVSVERLHALFDAAYMECERDEDGDLVVTTDAGPRVFVSLHEGAKLIRLMSFYRFRADSDETAKLRFVNAMNDDLIFARFSISESETLIADYYLPYAKSVPEFQIVNAVKLMGRVIISGIRQHNQDDLIE